MTECETKAERLGIFGGTFSPIHEGHVRAALAFLGSGFIDRLLVMPCAVPPHKAKVAGAGAEDRLEMARLAFAGTDAFREGRLAVSDHEILRGDKSYTVLTLEHFTAPGRELCMLVGTDMFLTLDTWYRAEDIFRLTSVALMRREEDGETERELDGKKHLYEERFGAKLYEVEAPAFPLSSTGIRARIAAGESTEGLLNKDVAALIAARGLYRETEL